MNGKKTALITGASNGIGKATAIKLAQDGFDLIATYYSDLASAEDMKRQAEEYGAEVLLEKSDAGSMEDIEKLARLAENKAGAVEVLVNNAGYYEENDFWNATESGFDRTFAVNTKGVFFLTQKIAKQMAERGIRGRIVNISSAGTICHSNIAPDYCMSKSAVSMLTILLSERLGAHKITVNAILPGPIPTKLNKGQFEDETMKRHLKEATALHEFGKPEYVAQAVSYLVSKGAEWTTGVLLNVDGGFTI